MKHPLSQTKRHKHNRPHGKNQPKQAYHFPPTPDQIAAVAGLEISAEETERLNKLWKQHYPGIHPWDVCPFEAFEKMFGPLGRPSTQRENSVE